MAQIPCEAAGKGYTSGQREIAMITEDNDQAFMTKSALKSLIADFLDGFNPENVDKKDFKKWLAKSESNKYQCTAYFRRFGINMHERNRMIVEQDYKCKVCRNDFTIDGKRRIATDHCHDIGTVRGILCTNCNAAEGLLVSVATAVRMAAYMQDKQDRRNEI